jgi:hypothetical protein
MSTPLNVIYQNSLRVLDRYLTFNESTCAVSNLADFLGEGGVYEYIHVCLFILLYCLLIPVQAYLFKRICPR